MATLAEMPDLVTIGATGLSIADVVSVARHGAAVTLGDDAVAAMARSYAITRELIGRQDAVYGLSTGFGALADRSIEPARRADLQVGLLRSHAATVGEEVEVEVIRAMMLLRVRALARGHSGIRVEVAEALLSLLNHGITPVVREHGSLGCSGDLAPLAHVGLALMGEGEVTIAAARPSAPAPAPRPSAPAAPRQSAAPARQGAPAAPRRSAAGALADAGLDPLVLEAKEGLALTNGTDGMLAHLCLACHDAADLLAAAEVGAALSVEGLLGTDQAFLPELMALRPHPGQAVSAAHLMALLADSGIVASHRRGDSRVQDAYSLRCAPQVIGAARDTLDHVRETVERELISAIDNPVVLDDGRVASCGNFHGAPLAYVADFLAIALADVASIAERRVDRLLDPARSAGLPAFLAADPGVDSGLMLAQYTAAALVAECRRLAVPASVDSVPTSAMQEDHVSMGWAAARKLRAAIADVARVVAIEVMAGARAVELRAPLRPAPATAAVVRGLRDAGIAGMGPDRYLAPEIDATFELVRSGAVVGWAESAAGALR